MAPDVRTRSRRRRLSPPPAGTAATVPGFPDARLTPEEAHDLLRLAAGRGAPDAAFDILALSGGAAGGAFGAGVLVGLTRCGRRPDFSVVTGVSTGALIAPFAFLGADWDDRLIDAYTGGHVADMFRIGSLGSPFGGSLLDDGSIEDLVMPFADEALLAAVAAAHAAGKRLLISTTNLDSQTACVWDMGAIASRGGSGALALFRRVLIASASLPGLFPPRLFDVVADGERYQEMHVDGGVAAPLFVMPDAPHHRADGERGLDRGRVYVIVNTLIDQPVGATQPSLVAILMQSFDTMLRFSYRQALSLTAAFCEREGLALSVAAMPATPPAARWLQFETASMTQTFDAAAALAQTDGLWTTR